MTRKFRTFALAALGALVATGASAAPVLRGRYQSGLGTLEVQTESGVVQGRYVEGGACGFDPERRVFEGELEGQVLVGTVVLCQTGAACAEKVYPFLGFYDAASRSVSGTVRLDAGCESPALETGARLSFVLEAGTDVQPPKLSAAEQSKRRGRQKKNAKLAEKSFEMGERMLQDGNFSGASQEFHRALSYDDRHWPAYLALGVAEFKLGHVQSALRAYERSRELRPDFADTYYNIACVHARLGDRRQALDYLRRAVSRYGFAQPEFMSNDPDLAKLLKDDPEFNELVKQASDQRDQQATASKRGRNGRR